METNIKKYLKTLNTLHMKRLNLHSSLFLLLFIALTISCSKDDDMEELSNEAEITNFKINNITATITGTDIAITLPNGANASSLSAVATISENATIDPDPKISADYSKPKKFTVTAQDGNTKKTYTTTVTIAEVKPSAENPFPKGVFILRLVQGQLRELDFRHASGTTSTKIFQNANKGRKIDGFSITDIIPYDKGYLIFSNKDDQSASSLLFTDLKLTIKKELTIEKANVNAHRYARIGNKIYYTNISDINEVNQPDNKSYIIDTDAQTLKKLDKQYKQFFADNKGQLYCTDIANEFNKVTDLNTLNVSKLAEFDQRSNSFVLDDNNVLWFTYRSRYPKGFGEVLNYSRGIFDYKLKMVRYDISTNTRNEGTATDDINRDSHAFTYHNKVYVVTNQNTHIANAKKELQEIYMDGNDIKLRSIHQLPKTQNPGILHDIHAYNFTNNNMIIFGTGNTTGNGNYYYDLDVVSGKTSDRVLNPNRLFYRKVLK
ncbi:MAG: DUF5018 domain-containing protein [Flavobacteriaceae bacterium]|nr:DUF5018 domain-containing protein [Flavobacteriaceae bacterium]